MNAHRRPRAWGAAAALAVVAVAALWTAHAFLHRDLFPLGHDQQSHVTRLAAFDIALREGQVPPLWAGDFYFGYGAPVFAFYPSLLYALAEPLLLAGADVFQAWRVVVVSCTLLTGALMYGWLRSTGGRAGAAAAAVGLTLAPYHLLDLYVRAAYTEYAAFACVIAMLWSGQAWMRSGARGAWFALVAAAAVLVGLHFGTLVMLGPLTALWMAALALGPPPAYRRLALGWLALAVALLVTVADWVPVVLEKDALRIDAELQEGYFDYRDHFLDLPELVRPDWGFGISRPDDSEHTSFQLGLVHWGAVAASCALLLAGHQRRFVAIVLGLFLVSILMTTPLSGPVWRASSALRSLQFPWRFMMPATIAASALLGTLPAAVRRWPKVQIAAAAGLCGLAAFAYGDYRVAGVTDDPGAPTSRALLDLYGPAPLDRSAFQPRGYDWTPPARAPQLVWGAPSVDVTEATGRLVRFRVNPDGPTSLRIERYASAGWRCTVNGERVELDTDPGRGILVLQLPPGPAEVELVYGLTPLRRITLLASGLVVLALVAVWVRWPRWAATEAIANAPAAQ